MTLKKLSTARIIVYTQGLIKKLKRRKNVFIELIPIPYWFGGVSVMMASQRFIFARME